MLKTAVLLHIFVETGTLFIFKSSKEQHVFEIEIIWNIINVFTVTFDEMNAKLLN